MFGTHVVLSDGTYQRLSLMCAIPGFNIHKLHFSKSISSDYLGYVFPKKRGPLMERLYKAYHWVPQFDLRRTHRLSIESGKHNKGPGIFFFIFLHRRVYLGLMT